MPEVATVQSKYKEPSAILAYVPDPNRGAFLLITPALVDTHAMVNEVPLATFALEQRLTAEWLFRQWRPSQARKQASKASERASKSIVGTCCTLLVV